MKVIKIDKRTYEVVLFHSKVSAARDAGISRRTFHYKVANGVYDDGTGCVYSLVEHEERITRSKN
jgi:hypothetical protein